ILSPLYQQVHLISGTAGGQTDAFGRGAAEYLSARPGFQRLTYYADGRLWAETVELDAAGQPVVVYRTEVAGINPELVDDELPDTVDPADLPDTVGGTVTATANDGFVTDRFQNDPATRAILGRNYRNVWKTPVAFEVLDMGTEAGGLTPVKRGGGLQTTGLRLLGGDGNEYGIRLLEKSGLAQVPGELRGGLVGDVVLELRAAMNPYGALVASPLARAAGVAQPDPRLVWVPDDPRLGRYRETFGDRLALFEVRPNDDLSDVPGFEGMTDIVSAADLREEMREDQDHRVDQRAFLRARLLDMFIADWDRHSDQWRWAAFEPGDLDPSLEGDEATRGKVYVPVARDRDFSFYGLGGLLQPLLQAFDNRLQAISETYGSVEGLTHNGFIQDRRFLNELTLADWRATAEDVQARLTDDVIEQAVRALPEPIYTQLADYWIGALKGRRDRLVEAAEAYYGFQSPTVDVIGSDEEELVEADRQRDGSLAVTIHSFKDGERGALLYQRTFQPDETDEVRIYGFAGDDTFRITGDGPRSISVRVIGGAGDDQLAAPGGNVAVYDTRDGLELTEDGPRVEDRRSFAPDVNRYDPTEVVLSQVRTVPLFGIQATDGALIGLGRQWLVPGFRLKPFAATHTLRANVATATGGVAASYRGVMREAIGRSTLTVEASGSTPRYARNFYGLGNGSPEIEDDAARVNLARLQARAGLGVPLGQGLELTIGPEARYADAARPGPEDPASTGPPSRLLDEAFDAQTHVGGFAWIEASVVDLATNPRQGARLHLFGEGFAGASGPASAYGRVGGEAALYVPFRLQPQLTLALRASGEHVFGGFPFFDAAVIGGPSSLRGYRRQRFAGRTAAMASAELRAKVLDLDIYVLPLQVGLLGFADAGRVWSDTAGECARVTCTAFPPLGRATFGGDGIQLGYGGGLWFGALDRAVFNVTVGASDEAVLISAGLGFAY
ncbi:MAG: BamA/TamA family outer membrane protein, partial [Bacteroidota bacterium]